MGEVVEGLGKAEREQISQLRSSGRYFWVDVSLDDTSREDLAEVLGIPARVLDILLGFEPDTPPSRRFHADGEHVAFPTTCYIETGAAAGDRTAGLRPIGVSVLVCGEYLLTVHDDPVSLRELLPPYNLEDRSEQYLVYAVLDGMVATAFDALNEADQVLEDLEQATADLRAARVRMSTLRMISGRLSDIRRRLGPQRGTFERIGEEIGRVRGLEPDSEQYFQRITGQLNRLIDGVDRTTSAAAQLVNLRVNATIYWLTVVATIYLPLTFISSFFGMNFGWMVGEIDTQLTFVLYGIGVPILAVALTLLVVLRRGSPVEPDERGRRAAGQSP